MNLFKEKKKNEFKLILINDFSLKEYQLMLDLIK